MSESGKARREAVVPQIVLMGGPNSGKSYSSLRLMTGIGAKKIGCIDTENRRSLYYAEDFTFYPYHLKEPYSWARYRGKIEKALEDGCDGLIIDQFTFEWSGPGGVLDQVNDSPASNEFAKWNEPKKGHKEGILFLQALKVPLIINVRAKVEYEMQMNERGKMAPVEKGFEAVQSGFGAKEKFEHEFPLAFLLKSNHHAIPVKDMTKLFARPFKDKEGLLDYEIMDEILTEEHGKKIALWAKGGNPLKKKS